MLAKHAVKEPPIEVDAAAKNIGLLRKRNIRDFAIIVGVADVSGDFWEVSSLFSS